MCNQRLVQVAHDWQTLQPTRLHYRQHPLHEAATTLAVTAKGILPPQHAATQHPLRVVIGWLDAFGHYETPHRRQQLQHVGAERRRLRLGAAATGFEHTLKLTCWAVESLLQCLSVATAAAEQMPLRKHLR